MPAPDAPKLAETARDTLKTALGDRTIYRLDSLKDHGDLDSMPYCIKVLLESCLRNLDGRIIEESDVTGLAGYDAKNIPDTELPFIPGRVVLQDFTGVPAVVDLAAMRDAIVKMTGDKTSANKVNPLVPCDLVIDHSVQVDAFNSGMALTINSEKEFERNQERYEFLKWGQSAFDNFRVVPPATGIVHQVNLEYLAKTVWETDRVLYPDSLVGTDSHTTMINGLGVVGWGVGGIEAEAVMLGQPIYMLIPEVVGFKMTRNARRRVHRDRPRAARHRNAARTWRRRKVRRVLRRRARRHMPAGQPRHASPTWRPSTAPRSDSSPSMSRRSTTCSSPAAMKNSCDAVEEVLSTRTGYLARPDSKKIRYTPTFELDLGHASNRRSPDRSARRIAFRSARCRISGDRICRRSHSASNRSAPFRTQRHSQTKAADKRQSRQ